MMAGVKAIAAEAEKRMKANAVLVTAAEAGADGRVSRLQVYFWDEHEAVMDVISRDDLIENWPDDGVYVLAPSSSGAAAEAFLELHCIGAEDGVRLRTDGRADVPCDDLGPLPTVLFMESVEAICSLKDKIRI